MAAAEVPRSAGLAVRVVVAALGVVLLAAGALPLLSLGGLPGLPALAALAVAGALGLLLLAAAARPRAWAMRARTPLLATSSGLAAFAFAVAAVGFTVGLAILEAARFLEALLRGAVFDELVGTPGPEALLVSLALTFLILTVPALVWAGGAEGLRGRARLAWLGLRRAGARASVRQSLVAVVLVFLLQIALGLVLTFVGVGEGNPVAEALGRSITPPLLLVVAVLPAVGEEVFFRGLLLRKLGNTGQAALFVVAHLNYLNIGEAVLTGAIGLLFGRVAQRTGSLAGPIVGHALFNTVNVLLFLATGA